MLTHYRNIKPFVTRDGSEIRELIHPSQHGNAQQSLAEATVAPGGETLRHKHLTTEEIYYITQGTGLMSIGEKRFAVSAGDSICIAPGTVHNIKNTGSVALKILCCCSPPYRDTDTLLE